MAHARGRVRRSRVLSPLGPILVIARESAAALVKLEGAGVRVVRASSFLENAAVGGPEGSPDFLNAVAEVETSLDADALLGRLLAVEAEMGRVRTVKWGPRVIDLDILLYGDEVIESPRLSVPHPEMHLRGFVLGPLVEIARGGGASGAGEERGGDAGGLECECNHGDTETRRRGLD